MELDDLADIMQDLPGKNTQELLRGMVPLLLEGKGLRYAVIIGLTIGL